MNDFRSLRILDRFQGVFQKLGVDYLVMRKIVGMKLTMDSRRMPAVLSGAKIKESGNQFKKGLWFYLLYGLLMVPMLFIGESYMLKISIVVGILFFILLTTMVSDFSSVLLDLRDKNILQTKPISGKTLNAAKFVHILIYMMQIAGAVSILPFVVSLINFGPLFAVLFLVMVAMVSCLSFILTAFCYLFILRFFNGELLKDVINYVQIVLTLFIFISYQLIGRVFEIGSYFGEYTFAWWHVFVVPLWFGAPFEVLLVQNYSSVMLVFSMLAVILSVGSIVLYVRLMPSFERNLSKLQSSSKGGRKKRRPLNELWSNILCKTKEERTFFRFASLMMSQEREFKLKVYPQLGFAIIVPFVLLINQLRIYSYEEVIQGNSFLAIYGCLLMIPTVVTLLQFSGTFKGHWVYRVAPLQNDRVIYSATLKAFITQLFLPIFMVISIIYILLFSWKIIIHLVVVLLVAVAATLLSYRMLNKSEYPFSEPYQHTQENNGVMVLLSFILIGVIFGIHYAMIVIPYGLYVYLGILLISIYFGWKSTFRMN